MYKSMLPSSLPFDILQTIPLLPAAAAFSSGAAPLLMQGGKCQADLSADMSVVAQFGTALTELLEAVPPDAEEAQVAASSIDSVMPQPKRLGAMILPVADNPMPRSEAATQPAGAAGRATTLQEPEMVSISVEAEVEIEVALERQVWEKVEEQEEDRDDEPEAPIAQPLLFLVEELSVVKLAAPVDAPKSFFEPENKSEGKQVKTAPATPNSLGEFKGQERQIQSPLRHAERKSEAVSSDGRQRELAPGDDLSEERHVPAQDRTIPESPAQESGPKEDRVTLRFRESMLSKEDLVEGPDEVAEPTACASDREADLHPIRTEIADATRVAAMSEFSSSEPPVAHRMEARATEILPRQESLAADKSSAPAPEQRLQPRVSAATAATILDKQASGSVKSVSIRLPIKDGSRAGSAVQIDVARKNSVLEVRLTGTSDGLQRAVTESIDSLVQKLAVDRWSLDVPASPDRSSETVGIPRMESILPESGESSSRPTLRMPSQEIASAAREMSLAAPAQSSPGQQSSDSQRNQDFQQDSGGREHPQQQQEEQRRPRRETWGEFLQAAEDNFEAGFFETAPELQ